MKELKNALDTYQVLMDDNIDAIAALLFVYQCHKITMLQLVKAIRIKGL